MQHTTIPIATLLDALPNTTLFSIISPFFGLPDEAAFGASAAGVLAEAAAAVAVVAELEAMIDIWNE